MTIKRNLNACVLALSIAGLSGCAVNPPVCPPPVPIPADLARPLPAEGWATAEMERILTWGQHSAPLPQPATK
jgi:hypothetical protein